MIRVLHLIPSLGCGGAERQIALLASGLGALGCQVHVGIVSGGPELARVEEGGAIVHRIEARGNYDPRLPFRIARLIRRIRPDVVHTWLTQMDVAGGLAAIVTRTPWIVSERTNSIYYAHNAKHRLRRFLGRFARAVAANSPGGADYWSGTDVPIIVVPNAVPLAAIEAAPRALDRGGVEPPLFVHRTGKRPLDATAVQDGDPASAEVVLFVGRLDEAKNLPNFIDACVRVVRERNTVVLLCGDGPLRADLEARIERAGVADRIRLLLFRDDVWSLMKRADVLVAPSWYEGHPNAVLEAIAAGCPLVVSDIPAHRAFLDESMALFAPPDDVSALTRAIALSLSDGMAARQRAVSAKACVAHWSVERISSEYLRIYEKVVA